MTSGFNLDIASTLILSIWQLHLPRSRVSTVGSYQAEHEFKNRFRKARSRTHPLNNIVWGCGLKDKLGVLLAAAPEVWQRVVIAFCPWISTRNVQHRACNRLKADLPGQKTLALGLNLASMEATASRIRIDWRNQWETESHWRSKQTYIFNVIIRHCDWKQALEGLLDRPFIWIPVLYSLNEPRRSSILSRPNPNSEIETPSEAKNKRNPLQSWVSIELQQWSLEPNRTPWRYQVGHYRRCLRVVN